MPFEKEVYDRYKELLRKGISIIDEVNEFAKQRVTELENEKNSTVIPRLKIFESIPLTNNTVLQELSTECLDVLNMSISELQRTIDKITDKKTLAKVQHLSHVLEAVTRTKIHKMKMRDGDAW